jgi:hypothetical protein
VAESQWLCAKELEEEKRIDWGLKRGLAALQAVDGLRSV